MKKIFAPSVHLMNNLKFLHKFLLISLIFLSIILGLELFIFWIISQNDELSKLELNLYRISLLLVFVFVLVLAVYFFSGLYLSITNSICKLKKVLDGVASRDFSLRADIKTRDEFMDLAESLNIMTGNINSLFNRENFLKEIILTSVSSRDYGEALKKIVTLTGQQYNADRCFLVEYDNEINDFRPVKEEATYIASENLKNVKGIKFDKEAFLLSGQFYGEDKIIVIENVDKADFIAEKLRQTCKAFNVKSVITVPIFYKNVLSGLLVIDYVKEYKKFVSAEIDFLLLIAAQIAFVMRKKSVEETKNTFIATLTHDLKSPTNAQQKALEVILAGKLGNSLDDFAEYLREIYKTNDEELRIINNILTVYHLESGRFKANSQLFSINSIIDDSVRTMMLLAKEQESEIIMEIQPDLPEIVVDKDEIGRVLKNLIGNAIKHTRIGTKINVKAYKRDNEIVVSVCDNGPGISEEERSKIFQRYPTEKRKIGTGLGLYLSKQLIEAHHGRIWFESEVGKGTTFYFTLPISDEQA